MSSLIEKLQKSGSVKHASLLSESGFFNVKDSVPTDIPIINLALSGRLDGGLTPGLTFLAGESKNFKSLLGLMLVKAYLKKYDDAVCLFYDTEFGITPEYIESVGIDSSRIIHIGIEHLEQFKFDISKRLESIERGDKVIVFVDSVGNMASKKELDDALSENTAADMSRAKAMKGLWRIVTPSLTTKNIPCVAINHTYNTLEYYSKAVMSGGCVVEDTEIQTPEGLVKVQDFKEGDTVETLLGEKEVTDVWNPVTLMEGNPECYEIEFEDGSKITCSENHMFLNESMEWVEAKDLVENENIITK